MSDFNGYKKEELTIYGREAVIVYPKNGTANGKWALKTEYFGAFPKTELALLEQGYHIAHIKNISRWYVDDDDTARVHLAEYMKNELSLSQKCVIVGMSCGGLQGIIFSAKHPELVSCMYLDAPVVNFLSIPFGFGKNAQCADYPGMQKEFFEAKGIDKYTVLSYREHPLDYLPMLVKNRIPAILVSGDADTVVDYEENGLLFKDAYENAGIPITVIIKNGGDHHPHGLCDVSPIVDFLIQNDK